MFSLPIIIETIQSRNLDLIILGSNENKVYKANELLNPMDYSGEYIKKSGITLSMEELKDLWGYQSIESKAYNQGKQLT